MSTKVWELRGICDGRERSGRRGSSKAEQLSDPWAVVRDSKGVWTRLTHPSVSWVWKLLHKPLQLSTHRPIHTHVHSWVPGFGEDLWTLGSAFQVRRVTSRLPTCNSWAPSTIQYDVIGSVGLQQRVVWNYQQTYTCVNLHCIQYSTSEHLQTYGMSSNAHVQGEIWMHKNSAEEK